MAHRSNLSTPIEFTFATDALNKSVRNHCPTDNRF